MLLEEELDLKIYVSVRTNIQPWAVLLYSLPSFMKIHVKLVLENVM